MATVSRLARKLLQCGGQTGARSVAGSQITRLGLQFDGLEQGGHGGGSDIGACAIDIVRKARAAWAVGLCSTASVSCGICRTASSINEAASSRISLISSKHTSRN